MNSFRPTYFTLFLLMACHLGFAQTGIINIQKYGFENGLSHRNVFQVEQDSSGFIWVATAKGLNRFDGHRFLTWRTDDEQYKLPKDQLHGLYLDEKERLILTFDEGGGAIFDIVKNTVDTLVLDDSVPSDVQINNLSEDGAGKIWGTAHFPKNNSIWIVRQNKENKLAAVQRLPGTYLNRPMARIGGLTYVGASENELWVFGMDGAQISQFEFPVRDDEPSPSRVIALKAGDDGTLWALLDHGQVYSLAPKGSSFVPHPLNGQMPQYFRSSAFFPCSNGDLWIGGIVSAPADDENSPCGSVQPGPSLFHFNSTSGNIHDLSYQLRQVLPYAEPPRQVFKDRTGVIWVSTAFGLIKLANHHLFTRYMADGNDCCRDGVCSMRGITEDDEGNIYFSYYSSIHVLNPQNGSLTPLFASQMGAPFGLVHHQGALWTGEGLRIDLNTLEVDTILPGLTGTEGTVMPDDDGELWFGNGEKLIQYAPESGLSTVFPQKGNAAQNVDVQKITWLLPSQRKGVFWMATQTQGVFEIKKDEGILRHFNTEKTPGFPHDRVLSLCETEGTLWAGTAAGLLRLNLESERIKVYTSENGLPNDFINGLLAEGDSAIWASTDNGLSRLDLPTERFTNFFSSDGISKNEFNRSSFFRASDGRMYFGGINGVNAFYPNARYGQQDDKMNSRVVLTGFEKFDGKNDFRQSWGFARNEKFELTHKDEMFSFTFALTDYTDPKIHQYSYQLEGYDQGWSEASPSNEARYFNIPAGNYTLRVRASRGGGDWVEDELSLPVRIREAFYKKGWFQVFVLGLIILAVYGIMQYRLHLLKEHEQELETLVQMRTQELETEKHKSDELLLNILPADTAEELKKFGKTKARRYENVTVMFSDFKDFSLIATHMEPEDLVAEIDLCFRAFDEITELYGLEKIKTVGDAYLLAGGISSDDDENDAIKVLRAALEMQSFLEAIAVERHEEGRPNFVARIGIHTGPVVAGIVGIKKFAYDIWGDTVNIAERLQSSGEVGKVNISKSTYELVKKHFDCTHRGKIKAKNKGEVDMYFVDNEKPS